MNKKYHSIVFIILNVSVHYLHPAASSAPQDQSPATDGKLNKILHDHANSLILLATEIYLEKKHGPEWEKHFNKDEATEILNNLQTDELVACEKEAVEFLVEHELPNYREPFKSYIKNHEMLWLFYRRQKYENSINTRKLCSAEHIISLYLAMRKLPDSTRMAEFLSNIQKNIQEGRR